MRQKEANVQLGLGRARFSSLSFS